MATDFELAVMTQLNEIQKTAAATAEKVESLDTRLFNGAGVITDIKSSIQEIKDDRMEDERWERIHNIAHYMLAPVLVAAHAITKHFGITW